MTTAYPDPFENTSPWDEPTQQPESPSVPVPQSPEPSVPSNPLNPFVIGLTLKASSGYEAEWITPKVYGSTAEEAATRTVELVNALATHGVIDRVSKAAAYTRSQYKGAGKPPASSASAPKTFVGGKVVTASGGDDRGVTTCEHGERTHRTGANWEAMFCPAREKSEQCDPAWLNKKSGKFEVK
ncbi:hypothetical protein [Streptomyces sp. Tu6071]|uniref:hypothetical protein n=1 Tax=Streptomyces sp. Tu6071 TaxID=355249 RepID=UPI0007C7B61E|nr:hypothetical protein [Streptomyces sp. Tu6071]